MTLEHIRFLKTRMGLGADASDIMTILNLAEERLLLEKMGSVELLPPKKYETVNEPRWCVHTDDPNFGATLGEAIRKAAEVSYAR